MQAVHIVIADDHSVVRRGLRWLLESQPGWEVCAEASNGREAVELAEQFKPNVAVLDVTMPELNGLEATPQIVKSIPGTEVLILTMHASEEVAREARRAGALGFMMKSDTDAQLIGAVETLLKHKPFFSRRALTNLSASSTTNVRTKLWT